MDATVEKGFRGVSRKDHEGKEWRRKIGCYHPHVHIQASLNASTSLP